ncbi:S-layer homology domain-containing protein [Paenibacillus plantarum]|nr:S-layer homology domain-containing protein [Paenibacillus plantarum]
MNNIHLVVGATDMWYAPYLQAATEYGLVSGYENGKFGCRLFLMGNQD